MPQPFTYQHFIQAVQSFKDDMLMCYFDEAVGIYCNLRHISVGPRPASVKDFSTQYADAYEAANNAILIVAKKIGSYNPAIGEFRSYLHTSLENALKDILKVDGYLPSFSNDIENEPDTTESDTDERVRRHKDDAFETMIRFIDTLPEIKRAAVYASAFGQVLRPDLKGYGRNYADILAQMYNTTALYIRQLATEGKQAAIDEVHRQGFNERSMSEVYMGALQVKTPARDINDEVLQAVGQLDEFQQFMLLRHLAGTIDENETNNKTVKTMSVWGGMLDRGAGESIRKEDDICSKEALVALLEDMVKNNDEKMIILSKPLKKVSDPLIIRDMIPIKDDHKLLSAHEVLLLQASTVLPFTLGEFVSLEDMLTKLGVRIIIEPGIRYHKAPKELLEAAEYWKKESERLKQKGEPQYEDALRMLEYYLEQIRLWGKMPIRGEYLSPVSLSDAPVIKLYPEEMRMEYASEIRNRMNELLVSTLAHEAMHAYFDRPPHNAFPYVYSIEEPMAEFGMLLFLRETKQQSFYAWARLDVARKATCYRYGVALMDQYRREGAGSQTRKDLEVYRIG